MDECVSHLFRVTVSIPSGRSWNVLVRAVDEESAAGAVRARGHHVVGVQRTERPARSQAPARISCLQCGYLLKNLPAGDAGEVMCPECGVINTSDLPDDSLWNEIKATRAEFERQQTKRGTSVLLRVLVIGLAAVAVVALCVRPVLQILKLIP